MRLLFAMMPIMTTITIERWSQIHIEMIGANAGGQQMIGHAFARRRYQSTHATYRTGDAAAKGEGIQEVGVSERRY